MNIHIQDFCGLKSANVTVTQSLTVLAGQNGQGKTSFLRAIAACILGPTAVRNKQPVRLGQKEAKVLLDLGDIRISRTFDEQGKQEVQFFEGGYVQSSPQTRLSKLVGSLSFDPLQFAPETTTPEQKRKQATDLMRALGLDLFEFEQKKKQAYDTRTLRRSEATKMKGEIDRAPMWPDAPDEPLSVTDLQLQESLAQQEVATLERLRGAALNAMEYLSELPVFKHLDGFVTLMQSLETEAERYSEQVSEVSRRVALLRSEIANASTINEQVSHNRRVRETQLELEALTTEINALTAEIEEYQRLKLEAVAACRIPVDGLQFAENLEDGLLFNGLPLEQASQSERLRVGMVMACILADKNLPLVLADNGEMLDAKSLEIVRQIAEEHGVCVLLARVGGEAEADLVLQDGRVIPGPKFVEVVSETGSDALDSFFGGAE